MNPIRVSKSSGFVILDIPGGGRVEYDGKIIKGPEKLELDPFDERTPTSSPYEEGANL